jgi:predicted TIM-barrel fold metal-dependent hydrolase
MIIDSHTHLGRPGGAIDSRAVDLIASMDKAGIEKALVFAGRMNSITTEQVIEEIEPHRGRLYAIGAISMDDWKSNVPASGLWISGTEWDASLQKMEAFLASGAIRGLKFYTGYEHYYPADRWLRPFLDLLVKYDRPAIFHSGDTFSKVGGSKLKYAMPIHIDDLAVEMPKLKIIIAHLGCPWQREAAEVVYKNENVYSDCSGAVYGDFTQASETDYRLVWNEFVRIAGGAEKILFGTDWPISGQRSYRGLIETLLGANEVVFSGNAIRLFGL